MLKSHSRRPGRKSLRFESLEDRRLLAAVSIADAMISEPGDTAVFVAPGSGGLNLPRDLAIGPDGNLYVASALSNGVLRYNSSTGQFIDTFVPSASGKPGGGLSRPFGLAFGPDGDLYVSSITTDSILHYRGPTKSKPGSFVNEFVPTGFEGLNDPSGIAFGSDGNLYVTNRITYIDTTPTGTGEILRFAGPLDANPGSGLPSPGNSGATFVPQGTGGLSEPFDLAFGPDGNLYVANQSTFSILRFDAANGGLIDEFVPEGRGDLVCPRGIAFDQEGQLYVTDSVSDAVHRYDAQGQFIDDVALPGVSGLAAPHGLAFDSQGSLLIGNAVYSSIARYDQGVTVTLSAASSTPVSVQYAMADNSADQSDYHSQSGVVTFLPGQTSRRILLATKDDLQIEPAESFTIQLSSPVGATLLRLSASVTITDDDAARQVVIADGSETEGDHTAHFRGPFASGLPGNNFTGVYFGPDGRLYASPGTGRTQGAINRYDAATGEFIDEFIAPGRINGVREIRFRDGHLYVGSSYTDEVLRFDATTGAFVDAFVTEGSGGLDATLGMDFGPDFNGDGIPELYVAGRDSFTVGRYDGATGAPLGTYVTPGSGGLRYPEGLTFDPTNTFLYVASQGTNQVLKYNALTGAFVGVAASTNISNVHDVRFGADGLLYVASGGNNRILRFNMAGQYVDDHVPAGSGGLSSPNRLAFGADGDLYVSSFGNSDILRYGTESEVVLNVSISSPSSLPVIVNYSTASGSATADIDFTSVSGVVFFPLGVTSKTITVPILDDAADEGNESFTVELSNPTGATITDAQGVGTIMDDEAPPTKFYVVNDATINLTYEYSEAGAAIENYSLNSGNIAPRGAASTAAGDKIWVIDVNKRVYVYNNAGGLLGSWAAGNLPSNAIVEGIATNGTDVWIVDARSDKVYRYAGAASLVSASASATSFNLTSGNTNPKDIVTDGTYLWVLNDSSTDKVFKYRLADSVLLGSWTITTASATSPTGITLDPVSPSALWIVDNGTKQVYEYANAVNQPNNSSKSADSSFALAPGNTNPQGIADPPVAIESVATMSANASVVGDFPSMSTSVPSRNYTPNRRPSHSTISAVSRYENLQLLARTNLAAQQTTGNGKPWQQHAMFAEVEAVDAALEELDYSVLTELAEI